MSERNSKHTPGPWTWRKGQLVLEHPVIHSGMPYGELVILEPRADLSANPAANRLNLRVRIASTEAPDLLDACRQLIDWYETAAPDVAGGPNHAYELAVAAARKATLSDNA
jgi:hypothetical protein